MPSGWLNTGRFMSSISSNERKVFAAVVGSLVVSIVLLFAAMLDLLLVIGLETPQLATHKAALLVMMMHWSSIGSLLYGTVFVIESRHRKMLILCVISAVLSVTAALVRTSLELSLEGYFPEQHAVN